MSTTYTGATDIEINALQERCSALQKENYELRQRVFSVEKKLTDTSNSLKDECARERARYRALEAKMDEFQLTTERHATKRVEDLMLECRDLRINLSRERDRTKALEQELDALSSYASERVNLSRRLEIAESRVADLETLLDVDRKQFLAEAAEQRALLESRHRAEIQAAVEEAIRATNENISTETRLLRDQNQILQKSVLILKGSGGNTGAKRSRTLSRMESELPGASVSRSRTTSQFSMVKASVSGHINDEEIEKFEMDISRGLEMRIGELKMTVKHLQTKLEEQASDFKREKNEASEFIANLVSKFNKERTDLLFEIKSLEKLVYAKCKELYKLRTLAQMLLQRRTDLEAFLSKLLAATLNLETRAISPYTMSEYFDVEMGRQRSRSPSPPPEYRYTGSAIPRSISPGPAFTEAEATASQDLATIMARTKLNSDEALSSIASKIPRTMAEMEHSLNAPIRVRSDPVINSLSAQEVTNIVRDWIMKIDIPV